MENGLKTCVTCVHSFMGPAEPTRPPRPDSKLYPRCKLGDGRLCGEMRKGACGPEAKLWEPKNG